MCIAFFVQRYLFTLIKLFSYICYMGRGDMMNILVTGGAGFIGSHLCKELLKRKCNVVVVDNFDNLYSPKIKENNIIDIKNFMYCKNIIQDAFKVIKCDIRDIFKINQIFSEEKTDIVVHLAAMAGVRPSITDPLTYTDVNVKGTVNLLEMCKKYKVNKFVLASSSSVYGNNDKVPFSEEDSAGCPISPYAASKRAGELFCYTYHQLFNIDVAALRFFTVYGPGQRPDLAIHKFTKLIFDGEEIPFYGDGLSERDYTYIDDIIDGIIRTIEWINKENGRFEIFNLGKSHTVSLKTMVELLERSIGKKAVIKKLPAQSGDVKRTCADIKKAREILGYNPSTDIETGINRFIEWYIKICL